MSKIRAEVQDKKQFHWVAIIDTINILATSQEITRHEIEWHTANLKTSFVERLRQIKEIENANQEAEEKYKQELEQYKQAVAPSKLITAKLELLMRYESHNSKQLMEAISKLEEYQSTKNQ